MGESKIRALGVSLDKARHQHLVGPHYTAKLQLMKFEIRETEKGRLVSFAFGTLLSCFDRETGPRTVAYPVFIDFYTDLRIMVGRAKPKAGLYEYMATFSLENATSTNPKKQIERALEFILHKLELPDFQWDDESGTAFRRHLYMLLKRFTETPPSIESIMVAKAPLIEEVVQRMHDSICTLPSGYMRDLKADILNLVEKYLSISTEDKTIFTTGREAYPLRLKATDDEDSRVEQTSGYGDPLQSKAIFFDNKKMLQLSECCDVLTLVFQRQNPRYHVGTTFPVRIVTQQKACLIKFSQYTSEEDILHAVFLLIEA